MAASRTLEADHLAMWERDGFILLRGFIDEVTCRALHDAAVALSRHAADEPGDRTLWVVPEGHPSETATNPEDFVAKIFRLHRREPFASFAHDPRVLAQLVPLLGNDVDIFLSQFIFKSPEAYGQPWHQDSHYFPFSESHQVGVWLAVTRATQRNGCLWVVPGTHREPIHDHVPDDRPNATSAYEAIVDTDAASAVPVEMEPGDLLLFDSHLMHSSTDNESDEVRASFVCHYSRTGVEDRTPPERPAPFDWVPALRDGQPG